MFNVHYKINCCQSCSYQIVAYAVNNEGFFMGPTHGPYILQLCMGPSYFWGGLTPPDPPPLISHTACPTPRMMYPSVFNRFPVIQVVSLIVRHFSTFFAHFGLPGYAPGSIAVNVTRLERGFNACKTPHCIYPSIFNRFWDIASYWSKMRHFLTPPLFSGPAGGDPVGISRRSWYTQN